MSLSDIFTAPLKDETKDWGLPSVKDTPWSRHRGRTIGIRDIFWNAVGSNKREEVFGSKRKEERKEYASFLADRMKRIREVREDPYPDSYREFAQKAYDSVPAGVLIDLARSGMDDEDIKTKVRAYVGFQVKTEAQKRYDELSDTQKSRVDNVARSGLKTADALRSRELLPSEQAELASLDEAGRKQWAVDRIKGPARALPEVETAQLAMAFGFSAKSVSNAVADHQAWLTEKILDNAVMDAIVKISEVPARALDWLAQQATGEDDITAGQAIFGRGNAASGAADAAKVFFLDTFVIFGKAVKGLKVAKGINRIDDMSDAVAAVERGVGSAPVGRFAKWWSALPDELRSVGFGDRNAEMFGWKMKPEAWNRLRNVRTPDEVKAVLREEALALGPSGVQNIEALPYLRPSHTLRRAAEMRRAGPFKFNNPLTGAFRTTWGNKIDPNSPIFTKGLRRFGDYLWGVENPTDAAARIVDGHLSRITTMHVKADRTKLMGTFLEDGLAAFATRHGATPEQTAEALKRTQDAYPSFLGRTRQAAYGIDEAGAVVPMPFRTTTIANSVPVPSYMDLLAFKGELRGVMGKKLTGKKLRAFDEQMMKGTRLVIRAWLAKPSTLVRAGVEETFDLAGHPEFGKLYRRQMGEQFLDSAAHLLHRGHPLRPPKMAEASADLRRELLMSQQYRGHMGLASSSVTGEVAEELAKHADDLDIDVFHWKAVDPEDATFTHAWYHQVNHQILQDPLSAIVVTYGDDFDTARSMGRMWLETPEGERYLRQLPTPQGVETANKADAILELHIGDISRTIPPELMPAAQGALGTGKKVSFADLEALKQLGKNPNRVVGPVPVSQLPAAEAERLGYFQQTKLGDVVQKPYGWGATFGDYMSRRPGFAAAKKYRQQGLERLRDARKKFGVDWGLSDEFIEKESTLYANREMWRMDNPLERSRSDYWLRNISPFQYNQNNFMKRWARKLKSNPGYVSRLRNMEGAMEDIGFIERDENGNLTFQVPISAEFYTNLIKRRKDAPAHYKRLAFSLGFGSQPSGAGIFKSAPFEAFGQLALPPGMPFAAAVEPGFGPMLTIPVQAITANKPKLDWLRNLTLGGYESWDPDKGWMHNLMYQAGASWARDLGQAVSGSAGDRAFVGTVRDLAAYAEFTGKDIFDPKVQEDLEGDAKFFYVVRALSKFAFPYAVTSPVFMEERDDLQKMKDKYGPEEGTVKFLEKYEGRGRALVTSMTEAAADYESNEGRPPKLLMAPSAFAEEFYRDNEGFFEEFPNVAGLFTHKGEDPYDNTAMKRQMLRGQRVGRNMQQFWVELNIEAGTREYYDNVVPFLDQMRAGGYKDEQVSAAKRLMVGRIEKLFPGTETFLADWSSRRALRDEAVKELRAAVNDPAVRDREDVKPLRTFLSYYDQAEATAVAGGYVRLGQQKGTRNLRKGLVYLYGRLFDDTKSVVLEKAYTYLFQNDLEDEEDDG